MRKPIGSIFFLIFMAFVVSAQQTTSFSYQGKLNSSLAPVTGNYDFRFDLYSVVTGGAAIGTASLTNVSVTNGIFTIPLDFGANAFDGTDRYLDISVKQTSAGAFTTLTPRQKIASVPYATKAIKSENADSLGGVTADNYLQKNGDASQLTNINGANITNNTISSMAFSSDALPNERNLNLLGSLRWDLLQSRNFTVGTDPQAVAFDGTNIWVVNQGDNNVRKLRASDGVSLGSFFAGLSPSGIAFDGTNMWVASNSNNNIRKLRVSDGATLGTYAVETSPRGVVFDGSNVWVANSGSNTVTKLRASDGANLGNFPVAVSPFITSFPNGLAFDGDYIWVANTGTNSIAKLRAIDGSLFNVYTVGTDPTALAFDGTNIWVSNQGSNSVTKVRAGNGAILGTFTVGSVPQGLAFDGASIWVTNASSHNVTKLRAIDGANLGSFPVGTNPHGIAFDGANMWVTNSVSNNVTKMQPSFPQQ